MTIHWSICAYSCQRTEEHVKEKYQNGCHLKIRSQNDEIFNVPILGAYLHIHVKYKVSIFNPVARRAVHRHQQQCQ